MSAPMRYLALMSHLGARRDRLLLVGRRRRRHGRVDGRQQRFGRCLGERLEWRRLRQRLQRRRLGRQLRHRRPVDLHGRHQQHALRLPSGHASVRRHRHARLFSRQRLAVLDGASIATRSAWVLYSNGSIFQVNTSDASCTATSLHGRPAWAAALRHGVLRRRDHPVRERNRHALHRRAAPRRPRPGGHHPRHRRLPFADGDDCRQRHQGWPELDWHRRTASCGASFPATRPARSTPSIAQIDKTTGANLSSFQLASIAGTRMPGRKGSTAARSSFFSS